jgi:hypothetical protein
MTGGDSAPGDDSAPDGDGELPDHLLDRGGDLSGDHLRGPGLDPELMEGIREEERERAAELLELVAAVLNDGDGRDRQKQKQDPEE